MPARKRGRQEADLDSSVVAVEIPQDNPTLTKLRSMWQFGAFMQYLFLFGRVVKVDEDFDMDEFEMECLRPEPSTRLQEVALSLLKYVSSHRGLTMELFDEYTRRQYMAKAPSRNPFGEEEEPRRFLDSDVFTKVRILHQLSVWTLGNADRIRQQMPEQTERDQTSWRIEELGWDRDERAYFVLDDDRLYRRTNAPLPPTPKKAKAKPKPKSKARRSRGTRSSKRQKLLHESEDEQEEDQDVDMQDTNGHGDKTNDDADDDDFGGMKWECLAITLEDYQNFLETLRRSTDADEKVLRTRIQEQIMPIMEQRAEKQRQKALKKQRELENLQKMATAKRSSRIAGRQEMLKQKEEEEAAERARRAELAMAKKEQEKQAKMEQARESRMQTREQRLREREVKRILHEEELKRLEENSKSIENGDSRISGRALKMEMERRQMELDRLAEEEDQWVFDCSVCGMHGENLDDGTHSIACDRCNIWQHSKCHNIREEDAEREDFHFVCNDCVKKEDEAKKPKIPPLRLRMGASSSPQLERAQLAGSATPQRHTDAVAPALSPRPGSARPHHLMDGPALSPQGQSPGPPGYHPHGPEPVGIPQLAWQGSALPPPPRPLSANQGSSPPPPLSRHAANGHAASPPPFQLHQHAHASAISSANMPHLHQPYLLNGHQGTPASHMGPPSPQKAHSRPSTGHDSNVRPLSRNSSAMTPDQQHRIAQPLTYSPNTSFPPPSRPQQYQQAAGHSPTKLPSSSPGHAGQQHASFYGTPSNSQQQPHGHAHTPHGQIASNALRPSPSAAPMHSSPIPPLPTGNTPVIPQKHDTPRPASRDSVGPIPPGIRMSPSPASFARPASSSGLGKAPSHAQVPAGSSGSADPLSGAQGQPSKTSAIVPDESKGHLGLSDPGVGFPSLPNNDKWTTAEGVHHADHGRSSEIQSSGHGEVVEGGGIAGVETEFGAGSVPVKKLPPGRLSSPPNPADVFLKRV
ncbi:hypothetical protein AAFC00_005458 [Neodothiora populina]|uniref:PHD-type domain-containing protein n=1 Tax=Neodothiora populina TaxID=2781224 RepID=A0ABR3PL80_9PEZI